MKTWGLLLASRGQEEGNAAQGQRQAEWAAALAQDFAWPVPRALPSMDGFSLLAPLLQPLPTAQHSLQLHNPLAAVAPVREDPRGTSEGPCLLGYWRGAGGQLLEGQGLKRLGFKS